MATHIDAAYLGAFIEEDARDRLAGSLSNLTTIITAASSEINAAMIIAGYDPDDIVAGSEPQEVKQATAGRVIERLYERKGLERGELFQDLVDMREQIKTGALPITGMTPNKRNAQGGAEFTRNSDTVAEQRPAIFIGKLRNNY